MSEHTGFHNKEHYSPDCPKCKQDELLLTEKELQDAWREPLEDKDDRHDIHIAKAQLAKDNQRYEQQDEWCTQKLPNDIPTRHLWHRNVNGIVCCMYCGYHYKEQKRLDRPELREKIRNCLEEDYNTGLLFLPDTEESRSKIRRLAELKADQILALILDEKE